MIVLCHAKLMLAFIIVIVIGNREHDQDGVIVMNVWGASAKNHAPNILEQV